MKTFVCPVCKSKNTNSFLHAFNGHAKHVFNIKRQFTYSRCSQCGAIFLTNLNINRSFYKKYYDKDYRTVDSGFLFKAGMVLVTLANRKKTQQILLNVPKKDNISILDIGSGHGDFLAQLPSKKFDRFGIEISADLINESKARGIQMYEGDFLRYDFGKTKFDCISLWHVIEHIPAPQKLLKKVHSLLKTNGVFIFSTPSTDALGFTLGKENWFHLEAPRHIILYNSQSLSYLAKANNFLELKTINNYLEFPTDLFYSLKNYPRNLRYYLFYPFYKYKDSETITCIWRKK
jgi:SAM-dependent methyltransferase